MIIVALILFRFISLFFQASISSDFHKRDDLEQRTKGLQVELRTDLFILVNIFVIYTGDS